MNPLIPRALELRASGLTLGAIAQQLGRSKYTISLYLDPARMARHVARSRTASAATYARDPVSRRAAAKEYATRNPEARKVRNQRYGAKNRWRVVLSRLEYRSLRSKDIRFTFYCDLQIVLIKWLLGTKEGSLSKRLESVLVQNANDFSIEQVRQHLESQFDEDQFWCLYSETWELGFLKSPMEFNLLDESQVREAFHYTNLIVITPEQRREQDRAEERFWKAPASKYVQ